MTHKLALGVTSSPFLSSKTSFLLSLMICLMIGAKMIKDELESDKG